MRRSLSFPGKNNNPALDTTDFQKIQHLIDNKISNLQNPPQSTEPKVPTKATTAAVTGKPKPPMRVGGVPQQFGQPPKAPKSIPTKTSVQSKPKLVPRVASLKSQPKPAIENPPPKPPQPAHEPELKDLKYIYFLPIINCKVLMTLT